MQNIFASILNSDEHDRPTTLKQIVEKICEVKSYSWVGLYDVTNAHIKIVACKGKEPAYPAFPIDKGLNGRAVSKKEVIVSNDIQNDPDYLTTFGHTQSEIIIPIISTSTNNVVGTIDVESENKNAFSEDDIEFLKDCAEKIKLLWE